LVVTPLAESGRGFATEFDVTWRMAVLSRHVAELMGEGRTVFYGERLKTFLAASDADREVMLERFWRKLDPDPETPVNEVYIEFRRRVTHVRRHLGGFGTLGATDPRGEIYLLLGPADKKEIASIPMNPQDQEDARIKVWERFAPDREGIAAKGYAPGGTQAQSPYQRVGGIPMPYSPTAERDILMRRGEASRYLGYELWEYLNSGLPLFENEYSGMAMGLRFLFVDKTGSGDFRLEGSNAFRAGE
jgi:GWxTD domain-containing protein